MSCAGCRLGPQIPVERDGHVTVGVLLPLSGKLKSYGEEGRDAVRLASGELGKKPDARVRVVIQDSKGDAAGAEKAVEELVLKEGAAAIVGPLFRAEAKPAAAKAQDLGVPLVALTSDRDVTGVGRFIFRAGVSPEEEMDALVGYAMGVLHLKRFAVLCPHIEYGERLLKLFVARVEERGGQVTKVGYYGAEDTTFTEPIQKLVHLDALSGREDYKQAIQACKDQPDSFRRARCEKEVRQKIPPIIEFDALFIPDGYKKVSLIAPALAAEDVIVERDPEMLQRIEKTLGRKVQPITLLGTSAWNTPELIERAGRSVENAIFADAYFDKAGDEATRDFVAAFKKRFQRRPGLQEALLYDGVRFLRTLLAKEHPQSREELRDLIRKQAPHHGVTGDLSFRDGADAQRAMRILTIKDQTMRVVTK